MDNVATSGCLRSNYFDSALLSSDDVRERKWHDCHDNSRSNTFDTWIREILTRCHLSLVTSHSAGPIIFRRKDTQQHLWDTWLPNLQMTGSQAHNYTKFLSLPYRYSLYHVQIVIYMRSFVSGIRSGSNNSMYSYIIAYLHFAEYSYLHKDLSRMPRTTHQVQSWSWILPTSY